MKEFVIMLSFFVALLLLILFIVVWYENQISLKERLKEAEHPSFEVIRNLPSEDIDIIFRLGIPIEFDKLRYFMKGEILLSKDEYKQLVRYISTLDLDYLLWLDKRWRLKDFVKQS